MMSPTLKSLPLVSLLCVSKNESGPALALEQAEKQLYPNLELVIINGGEGLPPPSSKLHIRWEREKPGATLGELRNSSVKLAKGEYVAQWDDDDEFHPMRIVRQLATLRDLEPDYQALVLDQVCTYDALTSSCGVTKKRPFEGSIIARRDLLLKHRYYEMRKGEDTELVRALIERGSIAWVNMPWLYTYHYHGGNTWDYEHFKNLLDSPFPSEGGS